MAHIIGHRAVTQKATGGITPQQAIPAPRSRKAVAGGQLSVPPSEGFVPRLATTPATLETQRPEALPFPETPTFTPPPTALKFPEFKDAQFFSGIKPDLQQIKQYEAVTGRAISPEVIAGMTEAKLGEASGRAVQVGQLNLERNAAERSKLTAEWNAEYQRWQGVVGNEEATLRADIQAYEANLREIQNWEETIEEGELSSDEIGGIRIEVESFAGDINTILLTPNLTNDQKINEINKIINTAKGFWFGAVTGGADWGEWSEETFFTFIDMDDPRGTTLATKGETPTSETDKTPEGTAAFERFIKEIPSGRPTEIGKDPAASIEGAVETTLPGTNFPGVGGSLPSLRF